METKSMPLVSVIIAANDLNTLMANFPSIANQTYENVEIIVVNAIKNIGSDCGDANSEKLQRSLNKLARRYRIAVVDFKKMFGYAFEPVSSNELFLFGSRSANGDYLIFCNDNISYSPQFIESSVNALLENDGDTAYSDITVFWEKDKASRYLHHIEFSNNRSVLESAAVFSDRLYGLYTAENKLIKRNVWGAASLLITDFYSTGNHAALYCGEAVFGFALWANSQHPVYVSDGCSQLFWKDDDHKVIEYADSRNLNSTAAEIKDSLNFVCRSCKDNGVSNEVCERFIGGFLSRVIWRIGWRFPLLKEALENEFETTIDDFSIIKVFEGRIRNIDPDDLIQDADTLVSNVPDRNIKIFVGMHKPSFIPTDNKYIVPIQLGAELADERFPDMLHDDEQENISAKNKMYCELTAQYYAWKNVKGADYYGFWHYRRYFSFNQSEKEIGGMVMHKALNDASLKKSFIDEKHIAEVCNQYDIIVPNEWHIDEAENMTAYEHWCKHFNKSDLDTLVKIIGEKYPQYYSSVMDVLQATDMLVCNMFIMNRELFEEYSEFLFTVLEEAEKRIDMRRYNVEQYRLIGHFGERMLAFFVKYIQDQRPEVSIGYVKRTFYEDTRPAAKIVHPKKDNCVSIMLACDNAYMKYTDVLLESILENSSDKYFYDIVICHRDISEENQKIAKSIFAKKDNFLLRFSDVTRNFEKYSKVHIDRHLTYETYYRFLVLDIFEGYNKVIYLDCDMVVNADISELFFTPFNGEYIAAVRDYDFIAQCVYSKEWYTKNVLKHIKIDDYFNYFQAGVILFNLTELKKIFTGEDLFRVALSRNWCFHDQDTLNSLFNGHVKFIEDKWNVFSLLKTDKDVGRYHLLRKSLAAEFAESYQKSRNNPCIIHYAGVPKVWDDADVDLGEIFWKYARNSPFYEQLLQKLIKGTSVKNDWILFANGDDKNSGAKFFTIKTVKPLWSSTYAVIDFMYLSNLKVIATDTLTVNAAFILDRNGEEVLDIKQFDWEGRIPEIADNVMFEISADNNIDVYVRPTENYTGFAFSVRMLESRCDDKPSVVACNHEILEDIIKLPKGLKKEI